MSRARFRSIASASLVASLALPSLAPAAPAPPPKSTGKAPPSTKATEGAPAMPPILIGAVPARIEFVAWLPVAGAKGGPGDEVDLDLRVEVVLPRSCGDKLVGLLRRNKSEVEAYDVILSRNAVGECGKDPVRIGARQALRTRLPEASAHEIRIGERPLLVARKGKEVTVDGGGPQGDVPGAPPTAKPVALVTGAVTAARVIAAERSKEAPWVAASLVEVKGKWPSCAGAPVGLLGRGDPGTHFALTRFEPLAPLPMSEACKGTIARTYKIPLAVKVATDKAAQSITIGDLAVEVKPTGEVKPAAVKPASAAPPAPTVQPGPAAPKP